MTAKLKERNKVVKTKNCIRLSEKIREGDIVEFGLKASPRIRLVNKVDYKHGSANLIYRIQRNIFSEMFNYDVGDNIIDRLGNVDLIDCLTRKREYKDYDRKLKEAGL